GAPIRVSRRREQQDTAQDDVTSLGNQAVDVRGGIQRGQQLATIAHPERLGHDRRVLLVGGKRDTANDVVLVVPGVADEDGLRLRCAHAASFRAPPRRQNVPSWRGASWAPSASGAVEADRMPRQRRLPNARSLVISGGADVVRTRLTLADSSSSR